MYVRKKKKKDLKKEKKRPKKEKKRKKKRVFIRYPARLSKKLYDDHASKHEYC